MKYFNHALFGIFGKKKEETIEKVPDRPLPGNEAPREVGNEPEINVSEEFKAKGLEVIGDILSKMKFELSVDYKGVVDGRPMFDINGGDDVGRVIGREGNTLNALQNISSSIVNRKTEDKIGLIIDTNGYKERRKRNLEKIAINAARMAKDRGQDVSLEPMTAADRRIVHMFLEQRDDVSTYSQGEGRNRHLVVAPESNFNQNN